MTSEPDNPASAPETRKGGHFLPCTLICLGVVATSSYYLWSAHARNPEVGFPLDDSWIHMQIARNLSQGAGMYFNAGDSVSASSAPLWTLALAGLHLLPVDTVWAAKGVGMLLLIACGIFTYLVGRGVGLQRDWAFVAGLATVTTPRLVWGAISGMEITLYAGLSTAAIWLYLKRSGQTRPAVDSQSSNQSLPPAVVLLCSAASLARPECLLLFPLILGDLLLRRNATSGSGMTAGILSSWRPCMLYAATLAPFAVFNLATIGHIFPNTYYAKVGSYGLFGALARQDLIQIIKCFSYYPLLQLIELIQFSLENSVITTLGVVVGACVWGGKSGSGRFVLLLIIALPLVRGVVAPFKGPLFQHGRYVAHLVPLLTIVGVLGLREVALFLCKRWRVQGGSFRAVRISWFLWAAVAANAAWLQPGQAREYAGNVHDIQQMHVRMATWLAGNTPHDAVIATHDIGALGYFSGRRIIDTAGLVTPEVLPHLRPGEPADQGVLEFLRLAKPEYVVILPSWYPDLAHSKHLAPAHEVVLEKRSISAGDRLVAYQANWP